MRILIAEDDPYSRQILEMILAKEKCWQVVSAKDGTEAWDLLQKGPAFDVCILDIMMPGIDGLQLSTKLRADRRFAETRIMLCSALNDRATVQQAAALNVNHYITKPYKREIIVKQLRRIEAERAAICHIEPLASMVERLGIDEESLCGMLASLQGEIEGFLSTHCQGEASPGTPEFSLRTNALKGAAVNLGAVQLATRLGNLEAGGAGHWRSAVEQVAAESKHLHSFLQAVAPVAEPA
ncbi:MAG TPA: response regulator [Lacunisphaera sp.]|nr:response regulator [Lacunisphaera sp.]